MGPAPEPTTKRDSPMSHDALRRSADPLDGTQPVETPEFASPPRPLGGRRISFLAWGLAGLAGIAIWVLIFKLV